MSDQQKSRCARRHIALCGLMCGSLIAALGCQSNQGTAGASYDASGAGLSAMQHPTLEGIPVPARFQLVADRSYCKQIGALRLANCTFDGKTDAASVFEFYKANMPSAGFTLRQWNFERGEYIAWYESHTEHCTIRIRREGYRTSVIVDVSPLPTGSAERDVRSPGRRP